MPDHLDARSPYFHLAALPAESSFLAPAPTFYSYQHYPPLDENTQLAPQVDPLAQVPFEFTFNAEASGTYF